MVRENFRDVAPQSSSSPVFLSSNSNSQRPFRVSHCSRSNCGCGYSGRGTFSWAKRAQASASRMTGRIALYLMLTEMAASSGPGAAQHVAHGAEERRRLEGLVKESGAELADA